MKQEIKKGAKRQFKRHKSTLSTHRLFIIQSVRFAFFLSKETYVARQLLHRFGFSLRISTCLPLLSVINIILSRKTWKPGDCSGGKPHKTLIMQITDGDPRLPGDLGSFCLRPFLSEDGRVGCVEREGDANFEINGNAWVGVCRRSHFRAAQAACMCRDQTAEDWLWRVAQGCGLNER